MALQSSEYGLWRVALLYPFLQKGLGGIPQVEVGIQLAPQPLDIQQCFLQQHQRGLYFHVKAAGSLEQVDQ